MADAQDALSLAEAQRRVETVSMALLHAQERAAKAERERDDALRKLTACERRIAELTATCTHYPPGQVEAYVEGNKRLLMAVQASNARVETLTAALRAVQAAATNHRLAVVHRAELAEEIARAALEPAIVGSHNDEVAPPVVPAESFEGKLS